MRAWAPRLNLVAGADLPRFEERHIEDSLRVLPVLAEVPDGPCIDVGSGAGLPGIPLAAAAPERHWRLLEPRVRRAGFLELVVRELGLDAEVLQLSAAEALASGYGAQHSVATARALAPPGRAFQLIMSLVAPGGAGLVFLGDKQGPPAPAEIWAPGLAIVRRLREAT